jgi:hypothetical protein
MDTIVNMICDLVGLDPSASPVAAKQLGWLISAGWTGPVIVTRQGEVYVDDSERSYPGTRVHLGAVTTQVG